MTNLEKTELRQLCKQGLSFADIRREVVCSDSTIRQYIRVFAPMTATPVNQPSTKITPVTDDESEVTNDPA